MEPLTDEARREAGGVEASGLILGELPDELILRVQGLQPLEAGEPAEAPGDESALASSAAALQPAGLPALESNGRAGRAGWPWGTTRRRPHRPQAVPLGRTALWLAVWPWLAALLLALQVGLFGGGFAWLAVLRHDAFRTNAEDLGFTDQVVWNWLRGQAFRFSLYEQAEFTTDIDLASLVRPDSLLAFHVEPMTALLAPLYLVWADVRLLLIVQALGWSLGAIPAYRLARRRLGSRLAGLCIAALYLLAPVGQWAVLSDFHTVTLAAPLLLWMGDLLDHDRPWLFLLAGALAASAKEEVGLAVAGLGLLALFRPSMRWAGLAALVGGAGWSVACVTVIIPRYAGTAVSPFTARYAELGGSPGQILSNLFTAPHLFAAALSRPEVLDYLTTLLLSGGWLALLAPELLLPAAPSLALNVLSGSPWMASGRAHYSAVVLPFVVLGAIAGLERSIGWLRAARARLRQQPPAWLLALPGLPSLVERALAARRARHARRLRGRQAVPGYRSPGLRLSGATLLGLAALTVAGLGYQRAGAGPLADGFSVPERTPRLALAAELARQIPPDARVSASSSLVAHLSQRSDVYLFPTVRSADYVLLDVGASSFPISAGDVYLRASAMLGNGDWSVQAADSGLLLLRREPATSRPLPDEFYRFARAAAPPAALPDQPPLAVYRDGALELVAASWQPTGDLGPHGPLGSLRTIWRTTRPLEDRPRPKLVLQHPGGSRQEISDFAALWWYPPERWRVGELVELEATGLPLRRVASWWAEVPSTRPASQARPVPAAPATNPDPPAAPPISVKLGELMVQLDRADWRLTVLDPSGQPLWREAAGEVGQQPDRLGFRSADGAWHGLGRVTELLPTPDGARLSVQTDDPSGRLATVDLTTLGPRTFRLGLRFSSPDGVAALGQALESPADERLLGLGERFTSVDQRGRVVDLWTEDRRLAGYGDTTYAPLPFLLSSRGYSLALETDVRAVFDLAASQPDRYTWQAETAALSLVFSYGPEPRALLQEQVRRTGLPPLPPIWAFGVWKTAVGGEQQVLRDAERLRALDIPVSALFVFDALDPQANLGWPHVTFQGRQAGDYGNLRALTDALHARGYKVLSYHSADFRVDQAGYAVPAEQGFLVRGPDGRPYVHPGFEVSWLDFTNPRAVDWWGSLWRRSLVDLGFDGGMLDLGELIPPEARFANGLDGRQLRNRYPLLQARAAFEAVNTHKPDAVLFMRAGAAGAQAYQHLQWPGDPRVTWEPVSGFQSMLPAALSAGLSGLPYWHPEIGGYLAVGLPTASERELWHRWLQLGAFSTLLRDTYGDHQTGLPPVEVWSDDETIAAFRTYAQVHSSLVPYLYSYARVASETGLPLMRHLALNWPDDPRAWIEERQYTLGDDLLVAPVLEEGARTRSVYLPAGQWVDFWSGAVFEGGREVLVEAPLDRIPVFARAGAILPLAVDHDSLASATANGVQTWNGALRYQIMPSNGPVQTSFRLFDGTELAYRFDGASARFTARQAADARQLEVHLPLGAPPSEVLVDGNPAAEWSYDPASRAVIVSVRAGDVEVLARR